MSSTVELINNKILEKIQVLRSLINSICRLFVLLETDKLKNNEDFKKIKLMSHFNLMLDDLDELEDRYNLIIISKLTNYYHSKGTENEYKYIKDFFHTLGSENIVSKIDDFVLQLKKIIISLSSICKKIELSSTNNEKVFSICRKFSSIESMEISIKLKKKEYEICKCGEKMAIIPSDSQLICEKCGSIKKLLGTVFEDYQFYNQEGQKTKQKQAASKAQRGTQYS